MPNSDMLPSLLYKINENAEMPRGGFAPFRLSV